jgi:hypothetical protein
MDEVMNVTKSYTFPYNHCMLHAFYKVIFHCFCAIIANLF